MDPRKIYDQACIKNTKTNQAINYFHTYTLSDKIFPILTLNFQNLKILEKMLRSF